MSFRIALLEGDGIGPEVTGQAERVLEAVGGRFGLSFTIERAPVGGQAIETHGDPLPASTLALCRRADAVLLGAVGGPQGSRPDVDPRPEQGLLRLRSELGLFANLRPLKPAPALRDFSPLRPEVVQGVDIMVVRELTGGLYFGPRGETAEGAAFDTCVYSRQEVLRIAEVAADMARARRGRVVSIDKANVLQTSRLWRSTVTEYFAREHSDLRLEHLLVDAAAMRLITSPRDFDVVLTENLFGDILSDEGSVLCGSLGMLPSASLGTDGPAVYEPVHGSAPDIAGTGSANPTGAILCVAMMLRHSLGSEEEAAAIEVAVERTLEDGFLPADVAGDTMAPVGTSAFGDAVIDRLRLTGRG